MKKDKKQFYSINDRLFVEKYSDEKLRESNVKDQLELEGQADVYPLSIVYTPREKLRMRLYRYIILFIMLVPLTPRGMIGLSADNVRIGYDAMDEDTF